MPDAFHALEEHVTDDVTRALAEDVGAGDLTAQLVPESRKAKARLLTRKGLDWTAKFTAIAKAAADLPDSILDGEVCALDHNGAPDFAALQAALSDGKSEALVFFVFDLLFADSEDLRPLPLGVAQSRVRHGWRAA